MPHHESKTCSRCGGKFECKAGSILQCQCMEVNLGETERHYLADHFSDCLCKQCLLEVQEALRQLKPLMGTGSG